MSEVVTISTGITGTIYGSVAGMTAYLGASGSDSAIAFMAADPVIQKQKLVDATRYLNRLGWTTPYALFATRDALDLGTGDGDVAFPFRAALYELAALAYAEPKVLIVEDQGSNIQSVTAGGAGVTYFAPTSALRGTAATLPGILMALIGAYLVVGTGDLATDGGTGETGGCVNPFGPCRDFDRRGPY